VSRPVDRGVRALLAVALGLTLLVAAVLVRVPVAPSATAPPPTTRPVAELWRAGRCRECHGVDPGALEARAPNLAFAGARAAGRLTGADYTGTATNAEEYLVESVVRHCVYVLAGYTCDAPDYGLLFSTDEVQALVAYVRDLAR
jgi:hypothetical protein